MLLILVADQDEQTKGNSNKSTILERSAVGDHKPEFTLVQCIFYGPSGLLSSFGVYMWSIHVHTSLRKHAYSNI